jgi:hypothetical protein
MFYFMLPVLIPAVIAVGWGAVVVIREQLKEINK